MDCTGTGSRNMDWNRKCTGTGTGNRERTGKGNGLTWKRDKECIGTETALEEDWDRRQDWNREWTGLEQEQEE